MANWISKLENDFRRQKEQQDRAATAGQLQEDNARNVLECFVQANSSHINAVNRWFVEHGRRLEAIGQDIHIEVGSPYFPDSFRPYSGQLSVHCETPSHGGHSPLAIAIVETGFVVKMMVADEPVYRRFRLEQEIGRAHV